ncbi:MAG: sulfatase-like hydrolase/transferase, partial [Bacteroidaceae bacterium]|nr:sulfatase-like hydrolase/transferase [Bacteroidaceae bacterium]
MKKPLLTTLTALTAFVPATAARRPNILLFMVDDMGWQDTSLPFHTERTPLNERFHTPNMERLARMGTQFTSAYACSISSPSRCSLLTGMNAARHRVTNWTLRPGTATDEDDPDVEIPQWNVNGIQPVAGIERSAPATSFVELLRQNGYRTIHCGKAHFGAIDTPGADPCT